MDKLERLGVKNKQTTLCRDGLSQLQVNRANDDTVVQGFLLGEEDTVWNLAPIQLELRLLGHGGAVDHRDLIEGVPSLVQVGHVWFFKQNHDRVELRYEQRFGDLLFEQSPVDLEFA